MRMFVLRHALARSGADKALIELLRQDAIVYAGYPASPEGRSGGDA